MVAVNEICKKWKHHRKVQGDILCGFARCIDICIEHVVYIALQESKQNVYFDHFRMQRTYAVTMRRHSVLPTNQVTCVISIKSYEQITNSTILHSREQRNVRCDSKAHAFDVIRKNHILSLCQASRCVL
ncbi:unnamed protein product [Albugo candida]|uniref:Uncharacterized protein n=1 Tax=Albugo candida TaxID=65357 RepID=A0A024FV00_9STRA|nr:unnamed protein product [Albugo candida]|eukprot:CCI10464.1 unnamed protein product [Albugo candida]